MIRCKHKPHHQYAVFLWRIQSLLTNKSMCNRPPGVHSLACWALPSGAQPIWGSLLVTKLGRRGYSREHARSREETQRGREGRTGTKTWVLQLPGRLCQQPEGPCVPPQLGLQTRRAGPLTSHVQTHKTDRYQMQFQLFGL